MKIYLRRLLGPVVDLMNKVFKKCLDKFIIIFINDILIYSKTNEEQVEHPSITLDILRKEKLYTKFRNVSFGYSKCSFKGT